VSTLICKNGEYYLKNKLKRQIEEFHEIPILEVSAYLFLLWKKERDALMKDKTTSVVSLWINGKFQPAGTCKMVKHLQKILKEFNPCLQMHKLDLISSLFQKRGESTTPSGIVSVYLNIDQFIQL
jgi:hypothetical protein